MIPFLKKKLEGSMSDDVDQGDGEEFGILDAAASDMLEAFEKKDKALLKQALEALCEYLREEDMKQDQDDNQ